MNALFRLGGRPSTATGAAPRRWPAVLVGGAGLAMVSLGALALLAVPAATATALHGQGAPVLSSAAGRSTAAPVPAPAALPEPAALPVALPIRLTLPAEHAAAPVVPIGVRPTHDLDLPEDPRTIGWWSGGPVPGDPVGSAVLAGHIDSADRGLGTFAALLQVHLGDPVVVTGTDGSIHRYVVSGRTTYAKRSLPATVFDATGAPGITLITCGGPYDQRTHHYRDNVVVTARPVQ